MQHFSKGYEFHSTLKISVIRGLQGDAVGTGACHQHCWPEVISQDPYYFQKDGANGMIEKMYHALNIPSVNLQRTMGNNIWWLIFKGTLNKLGSFCN